METWLLAHITWPSPLSTIVRFIHVRIYNDCGMTFWVYFPFVDNPISVGKSFFFAENVLFGTHRHYTIRNSYAKYQRFFSVVFLEVKEVTCRLHLQVSALMYDCMATYRQTQKYTPFEWVLHARNMEQLVVGLVVEILSKNLWYFKVWSSQRLDELESVYTFVD